MTVRNAVGAGRWFSASSTTLKKQVENYIEKADVNVNSKLNGRIVAALSPHAGFDFSGHVAGYVFKAIRDQPKEKQPETLVIVGFSHSKSFKGIVLMDGKAIRTPIGESPLDVEASTFLSRQPEFRFDYRYHNGEHSAENEIPFAQIALPNLPLVVALIGESDSALAFSRGVAELNKQKRVCVVASTDMLHDENYDKVQRTDAQTLQLTEVMNLDGLRKQWSYDNQVYCGINAVLAAMTFAKDLGCKNAFILKHACSGDNDKTAGYHVGYGAVVMAA